MNVGNFPVDHACGLRAVRSPSWIRRFVARRSAIRDAPCAAARATGSIRRSLRAACTHGRAQRGDQLLRCSGDRAGVRAFYSHAAAQCDHPADGDSVISRPLARPTLGHVLAELGADRWLDDRGRPRWQTATTSRSVQRRRARMTVASDTATPSTRAGPRCTSASPAPCYAGYRSEYARHFCRCGNSRLGPGQSPLASLRAALRRADDPGPGGRTTR